MNWICRDCAFAAGTSTLDGHLSTMHQGHCDWCDTDKVVTEPRDYRPRPAWPKQDPLEALGHALNHEQHDPLDAMGRAWAAERRRTGQK